ncbi:hypothetical protein ACFO0J_02270 [Castellaniella hirudinis]|uniref:Uncharacterized protein n=1 Tax=Castellaniella hirudinis TaxID=1144617 RepID=A0ABV8RXC4_9BURK
MPQIWKLWLSFIGVMAVIMSVMALMPMLIIVVAPALLTMTKWSMIARVADSVLHESQEQHYDYKSKGPLPKGEVGSVKTKQEP